ncbi:hypothetical protein COLO4_08606 [Corchorus olitorius]|uniref:Uncharacterized protein n=1 Tax=Corchorus olitorius TaxID=93759 RepID=A0A1R3KF77_9ROSI|nr:hypothetical protein COLO4_08606 [Corchorus olitorius]
MEMQQRGLFGFHFSNLIQRGREDFKRGQREFDGAQQ